MVSRENWNSGWEVMTCCLFFYGQSLFLQGTSALQGFFLAAHQQRWITPDYFIFNAYYSSSTFQLILAPSVFKFKYSSGVADWSPSPLGTECAIKPMGCLCVMGPGHRNLLGAALAPWRTFSQVVPQFWSAAERDVGASAVPSGDEHNMQLCARGR